MGTVQEAIHHGMIAADFLWTTKRVVQAIELWNECLTLLNKKILENEHQLATIVRIVLNKRLFYGNAAITKLSPAIESGKKLLVLLRNLRRKKEEGYTALMLSKLYFQKNEYQEAQAVLKIALCVYKEIEDEDGEATCYVILGAVFLSVGEYAKAEEYLHKALTINTEIGDRNGEATCYGNLGNVFESVGEYAKAEEYLHKALTINTEIGDRKGEATCYGNLGNVFESVGEYAKAEEYLHKALTINTEIRDRKGEATCYVNLGAVFLSVGEYAKAEEYLHKALTIKTEIGDRNGEAACYGNLGNVFESVGEYAKAEEYLHKALTIKTEIGDRNGEATCYASLGNVFESVGEYAKAEEYLHKALTIKTEIGDRNGEATCYASLGNVFQSVGEYAKAEEHLNKALTINTEIGDRNGEAACYVNLGAVFQSVGEYAKAEEYLHKALTINTEIGDRKGEATCYVNLGAVFKSVGEYAKAEEYLHKALTIKTEIGDRKGEAACYGNLGAVFKSVGEYAKAEEYLHKALTINTEIGDREGEARCYGNLGALYVHVGEYGKAEENRHTALTTNTEIGDKDGEASRYLKLRNTSQALSDLWSSIQIYEKMLTSLGSKDSHNISFFDKNASRYRLFCSLSCSYSHNISFLHAAELGRARALAELMSNRYSIEKEISINPQSFVGIAEVIKKNGNSTYLYISYDYDDNIFLWVLKQNKPVAFRRTKLCESYVSKHGKISVYDLFGNESLLRKFHVLPQEQCEDRSLFSSFANQLTNKSNLEDSLSTLRPLLDEGEVYTDPEPPTLFQVYNLLIAPVSDLLEGSEIIVVPDRCFFQVPFAALHDESSRYLSDSFRIRIVPSLTTLKLILDSPADSHSETGALIVGEPRVTDVYFKGVLRYLCPLPGAKGEAEMIARLLPKSHLLIGKQATKQAVLQRIPSMSLVHFAAHGDAERGEIALSPADSTVEFPHEADYLLSMTDISQVRLSAKLVVLSCCHTARGQIKTEGVVGIARAFLGSGARSVLVALWALQDRATEEFMGRFYENLVQGKSASESLHRAMKWMRNNGFSEVRQWAPFMLIGDDVSFHFGEEK
ncbi:unnamed protein product [Porites lobata]|uniref:CHAT domain-containing protein n=1 Tax=Porites lobata TaxID=104759 RepID=A0ABN8RHD9_9CNID|nr:unnamed protein product [Porites lobata]